LFAGELDLDGTNILTNRPEVLANPLASRVDLLRVDTILGVQVLDLPIGEDPVELVIDLVLGPESSSKSQTLFLPGQLQEVGTLPHDGSTPSGHFKDLFFRRLPCDHIELLHLGLPQKPTSAASEDRGRRVWVQFRWGEPNGCLFCGCLCGFIGSSSDCLGQLEGLRGGKGEGGGLLPWHGCTVAGFETREGWGEEGGLGCHGHG